MASTIALTMNESSDITQETNEAPRSRWRLLYVAMSTICWIIAVMFLLGWLARLGESFYIN